MTGRLDPYSRVVLRLFGLKPTRGRNPLGPHHGDLLSGLVVEHAVTRSVRDSAALLDATTGPTSAIRTSRRRPRAHFWKR